MTSRARDLRRNNRASTLSVLLTDGPLSRGELSRITKLSVTTVGKVINEMIDEGLVVEAGRVGPEGGRPTTLLRVDQCHGYVVGVAVEEELMTAELFDLTLGAVAATACPLPVDVDVITDVLARLSACVEELLARSGVDRQRVVGVGVAVSESLACEWAKPPGAVASQHTPPPLQFLRFGSSTVPVFFDHMARTLSQAESWFAGVRGTHGTLTVVIDTGISAAMAGDGMTRPMPPARLIGLGHTVISYRGRPCRCGSLGCLDAYAGVTGILDRYRRTAGNRVCHDREERRALATLVDSATRSRTARKVLAEAAGYLGAGIGGLINLLDPDRVLLGGWAGQLLGAVVLGEIREAARDHSVRRDHDRTTIQLCPPGPEMAERGAATLPIMALFLAGGDTITTTVGDP